ncbi:6876_t:CDS:2, partial [Acaulospora colombiana]
ENQRTHAILSLEVYQLRSKEPSQRGLPVWTSIQDGFALAQALEWPILAIPETDLTMPAATFLPHADTMDWEMFGPENTIDLCEVTITFTSDVGWGTSYASRYELANPLPYIDMKTTPISSIHGDHHDKFYNLLFVPKTPDTNATMSIDNDTSGTIDRYLLVESVEFGSYSGPPITKLKSYSLLKHKNDQAKSLEWSIRLDGSRVLAYQTILHLEPGWPGLATQRG